jgi:hypothetical protein
MRDSLSKAYGARDFIVLGLEGFWGGTDRTYETNGTDGT